MEGGAGLGDRRLLRRSAGKGGGDEKELREASGRRSVQFQMLIAVFFEFRQSGLVEETGQLILGMFVEVFF